MGVLKKKFRSVKKLPDWIFVLPALLMKLIFKCLFRFELIDKNGSVERARGYIGMAWHKEHAAYKKDVHILRDGDNLYGEYYDFDA